MIKEALEYLTSQAILATETEKLPGTLRKIRRLVNGEVMEWEVPVEPRDHFPATLDEVIALATRFAAEKPVVWFDHEQVTLVIDDAGHRIERATLNLEVSDTFGVVQMLRRDKPWYTQPDFVRLLRVDLAGTLDPAVLLNRVRKLVIGQKTTTEVQRRGESFGHEINALAGKDTDPPDEVDLVLPVYKTPGEQTPVYVACTVDVEVAQPKPFRLIPKPDEVERVLQVAVGAIGEQLRAELPEGVQCYHGRP
jgi:anti-sigma factor ChrR (cupin superfamily)